MKAKKTFEILWDESAGKELKNLLKEIQVKSAKVTNKSLDEESRHKE